VSRAVWKLFYYWLAVLHDEKVVERGIQQVILRYSPHRWNALLINASNLRVKKIKPRLVSQAGLILFRSNPATDSAPCIYP
jgi:hypothetical protein